MPGAAARRDRILAALLLGALVSPGGPLACHDEPAEPVPEIAGETLEALERLGYVDFAAPETHESDDHGVVFADPERSWRGYDLITLHSLAEARLVDGAGEVRRRWKGTAERWERSYLGPDGDLWVLAANDPAVQAPPDAGHRRSLLRLGFEGELRWQAPLPVHHALAWRSDGRVGALTRSVRSIPEMGPHPYVDNGVAMLSRDGRTIETEHSLYDMLSAAGERFRIAELRPEEGPRDFLHANALQWMPGGSLAERHRLYRASNVLVTLRKQDAIAVFDLERGELVWAWGPGEVVGPHEAQVLPDGNILLFDNRSRSRASEGDGWSRIVELDPLTRRVVWEYRGTPPESFHSNSAGTVQRLPNGNTLIASTNQARLFEVTAEGERVFEYRPEPAADESRSPALRANRYAPAFVESLLRP